MVTNFATDRHPGTNIKRSQIAFAVTSIALNLGHLVTQLLKIPAQSLIETSGTPAPAKRWDPFFFSFLLGTNTTIKKMEEGETGGASNKVEAESSGEDPRATGGLVSNFLYPRAIKQSNAQTQLHRNDWTILLSGCVFMCSVYKSNSTLWPVLGTVNATTVEMRINQHAGELSRHHLRRMPWVVNTN